MVATLRNACSQDVPFVAQPLFATTNGAIQGGEIRAADVAQFNPLEIVPQPLGRVELRRVAGQAARAQRE